MGAKRILRIPEKLSNGLNGVLRDLAELKEETNGVLLYEPVRKPGHVDCRVDLLYMTGIGTTGHVRADPMRMEIINEFFQNHPEYRFVKWHTHSRGTGKYWHDKLSQGDMDSYREQIRQDPEFMGMMVSPSGRRLVAKGPVEMHVVPTWGDFEEKASYLSDEMSLAANALGYREIPTLKARKIGNIPRIDEESKHVGLFKKIKKFLGL